MSDFTRHGKSVVILLFLLSYSHLHLAQSETHDSDAWVPNGMISRVEHSNGYTMLSGFGLSLGRHSGGAVLTDVATGKIIDTGMPKVHGEVHAIESDGNGGWFISGDFNMVDTVKVINLVHIRSDKTVDRTWKPNPDGAPTVLKLSGTTLYAGGYFGEIAGESRNYLASFNTTTGALTDWNPEPNSSINDIEVSGSTVIVSGSFTQIAAATRTRLASFDASTGNLTAWQPNVNSQVLAMAIDGTGVFVGGFFDIAGDASRVGLSRIDLTSGLATGPTINLSPGGYIYDLEVSGGNLYMAGNFTEVNGVAREHVASVNATTGALNALNLDLTSLDYVEELSVNGSTLYVAGYFTSIAGGTRSHVAAVNATTGVLQNWSPEPTDGATVVLPTAGGVWVGGYFNSVGGEYRNGFALIEEATNTIWPFPVDIDGYVNTIAVQGNTLYIGGQFSTVNNFPRENLAALDLRTGSVLGWNPGVYGVSLTDRTASVQSMRIKDNRLFIGGHFYAVNSLATVRPGLAAIDLTTGAATSWNPTVGDGKTMNQYVLAIDILDNTLYVGGSFNLLNLSVTRNNLAAINTENANILNWNPNSGGEINRIRASASTIYVTGSFGNGIGGVARPYGIAAIAATTGTVTTWAPQFDGFVYDVALAGDNVFVAGYFSLVSDAFRPGLAAFSLANGSLTPWTPDIGDDGESGYSTYSVATSTSRLFVAGNFRMLGTEYRQYYAEYSICPEKPTVVLNGTTLSTTATGALQWYAYGQPVLGATQQTFEVNPLEYGVYAVSVALDGCQVISDDVTYIVTALETLSDGVKVYPNPVADQLTIELPHHSDMLDVTVTDIMGRVVNRHQGHDLRYLSFAGYRPGTYVLVIRTNDARYVKKIMKIR